MYKDTSVLGRNEDVLIEFPYNHIIDLILNSISDYAVYIILAEFRN